MKFYIDDYEVDIKVKSTLKESRNNKHDAMALMNLISIFAMNAEENYKSYGSYALAQQAHEISEEIYEQLEAMGCYK
jgi:hypothetical protein